MKIPSLSSAISRIAKDIIANGSLLLVIGVAVILSLSVFTMLPQSSVILLPHQPQSAFATFPGENGKIAYTSQGQYTNRQIYVMEVDKQG